MQEEGLEEQRQVPVRYKKYKYDLHGYRFLGFGKNAGLGHYNEDKEVEDL
jgi:hypothetical protein